jgi:hypothetical protein
MRPRWPAEFDTSHLGTRGCISRVQGARARDEYAPVCITRFQDGEIFTRRDRELPRVLACEAVPRSRRCVSLKVLIVVALPSVKRHWTCVGLVGVIGEVPLLRLLLVLAIQKHGLPSNHIVRHENEERDEGLTVAAPTVAKREVGRCCPRVSVTSRAGTG